MADKERVTVKAGDVGILPSSVSAGPKLKARELWDAGPALYKGQEVQVVRGAHPGDGEGFDPSKPQLLVTIDGKKTIVDFADIKAVG